jgi:hypothetical protein
MLYFLMEIDMRSILRRSANYINDRKNIDIIDFDSSFLGEYILMKRIFFRLEIF